MSDSTPPPDGRGLTFGELVATLRQIERDEHPTGPFCTIDGGPADPASEAHARMQYFVLLDDQRRNVRAIPGYEPFRTLLIRHTGAEVSSAACCRLLSMYLSTHPHLSAAEVERLPLTEFIRRFSAVGQSTGASPAPARLPFHPALRAVGDEFRRESERNGRLRLVVVAARPREEGGGDTTAHQGVQTLSHEQSALHVEITRAAAEWGWLDLPVEGDAVYPATRRLPDQCRVEYGAMAYGDPSAVEAFCRLARQAADTLPSEFRITPPLFVYGPNPHGAEASRVHRWVEFLFVAEPGLYRYQFVPECPRVWHAVTQRDPFLASYVAIQTVLGNDLPDYLRRFGANVERYRDDARTIAESDDFGRAVEQVVEAGRRAAGLSSSTPVDDPTPLGPSFDDNEVTVLQALDAAHPRTMRNVEIEAATDFSKATVQNCVNSLISKGLAHRPNGERKGAAVTDAGRDIAARLGERP